MKIQKNAVQRLVDWFEANLRPLPWRENRDPYRIWISETMLQQTTSRAVIPYFEKFIARFPDLASLGAADEAKVRKYWAGLGYYSRATNLWRAAHQLSRLHEFPRTAAELSRYPGFGPYTARAVSSLAFGEKVGVVDGNVIRVLSRLHGLHTEWWKPRERRHFQSIADSWVQSGKSDRINQALMELGATLCTPKSPSCLLCPLRQDCTARKNRQVHLLPLARPKRAREIWLWQAEVTMREQEILLNFSKHLPFSRRHPSLPGSAKKITKRPRRFDYQHSITHHDIFVSVKVKKSSAPTPAECRWVSLQKLDEVCPTSLVKKALQVARTKRLSES